jgi:hypothetical protein
VTALLIKKKNNAGNSGEDEGLDILMSPLCDCFVDVLRPLYIKVCVCVFVCVC